MSALPVPVPDPADDPAPAPPGRPEWVGDVVVAGYRLHVAHRPGAPGRTPLVLVNGIGASVEFLDPLVAALDPDRPVVRFDVPGIGGSPLPWVPLPMAGLAGLLSGLLDELGYARADVLGLSWGGGIAQQFALQHPDRTGRLALVSTGMGAWMVPARLTVLAKMLTPRRYNDRRYRHDAGAEIYVGEDQAAVDEVFGRARPVAFRGYLYQLMALMTWTSLPVLPFISAPTLVLAGRRDPVIPIVNAHIMGGLIPRATVHLHQGGHVGILTRPDELGPVLEDFLDG
ncbi:poly(3-hydroxyalkanoate) depolymerase [Actinomycetospora succinea]|uniref:Poly(3-hydroxyalkanoate) depolymerase n=1 Tax=Actinomycetospora succinea TaxID=663603 RepID=A0A4R6VHG7_9PSEU|nr:alpha/beta hydrolase [Actinomycetospora succinea]TDQ60827.1 poly(3-hydroxyalkanoate) depolymerase [Actinomycetospora succinea]